MALAVKQAPTVRQPDFGFRTGCTIKLYYQRLAKWQWAGYKHLETIIRNGIDLFEKCAYPKAP